MVGESWLGYRLWIFAFLYQCPVGVSCDICGWMSLCLISHTPLISYFCFSYFPYPFLTISACDTLSLSTSCQASLVCASWEGATATLHGKMRRRYCGGWGNGRRSCNWCWCNGRRRICNGSWGIVRKRCWLKKEEAHLPFSSSNAL